MFSFTPFHDSQFYPQSAYLHGRPHNSTYVLARAEAARRERERIAAARRLAAEQEARARLARFGYQGKENDGYDLTFNLSPREQAYPQVKGELMERARIMEARKLRKARLRAQMERERRAALEQFYRGFGLRETDKSHTSETEPELNSQTPAKRTRSETPTTSQLRTSAPTPTREERDEAASKIQNVYRAHLSLRAISSLQSEFEALKAGFTLPSSIDFIATDGSVIALSQNLKSTPSGYMEGPCKDGKLAFTVTNIPILAYDEGLNKILAKLDAVESWGIGRIRERRKAVVRAIEEEAAMVEAAWTNVWKEYVGRDVHEEKMDKVEVVVVVGEDEKMDEDGVDKTPASESSGVEPVEEAVSSNHEVESTVEEASGSEPLGIESVDDVPTCKPMVESTPLESEPPIDVDASMIDTIANISDPDSSSSTVMPVTTIAERAINELGVISHPDDTEVALDDPSNSVQLTPPSHFEAGALPTSTSIALVPVDTENSTTKLDDALSESESQPSDMESDDSDYESAEGSILELERFGGAEHNDDEGESEKYLEDFVVV